MMINPSYWAPVFVARLVPVSHLNAEFLYELVLSVIKLVHDVGGRVFCITSDILTVNRNNCKMLHETFKSESDSSFVHPFLNSKFSSLFTLYDPTQLFKNLRNNWITEKIQTLEFLDPEINEVFTAK